jgi:transposase-like protein
VWDVRAWIISVLIMIAFGTVGWSWHAVTSDVDTLQVKLEEHEKNEAAEKATVAALADNIKTIVDRGVRMEAAIDDLRKLLVQHSLKGK